MSHAYTEDRLVEQPAIGLFGALGWQTVSALEETFGASGTLGRETRGEVVLVPSLRAVLCRFNPAQPPEAISNAIDELTRDRSAMSLEAANREVYQLLKDGIAVSVPDLDHGGQKTERLRVVDWEHPENNDFLLVSQFSVVGSLYTCRPDLIGFVNGLPWVVIELKKPGVPARAAFDENLTHYKQQIPQLFWCNAFLIASNGTDSRIGSLTADWGRWVEWKRIEREDEPRRVSLEVMLVRFPYRKENRQRPMIDSERFRRHRDKAYVALAEIKTGVCRLNGPWTAPERENMQRVLSALGMLGREC